MLFLVRFYRLLGLGFRGLFRLGFRAEHRPQNVITFFVVLGLGCLWPSVLHGVEYNAMGKKVQITPEIKQTAVEIIMHSYLGQENTRADAEFMVEMVEEALNRPEHGAAPSSGGCYKDKKRNP